MSNPKTSAKQLERSIVLDDDGFIDLDKSVVILEDGTRLTEELADALVAEAEAGYDPADGWTFTTVPNPLRGRPPLSTSGESAQLRVRVEPELNGEIRTLAAQEGRSLSALARDALREYAERHAA